jgi:hypothetical protein
MFAIDLLKGKGLPQKTNWRLRIARGAGLLLPWRRCGSGGGLAL